MLLFKNYIAHIHMLARVHTRQYINIYMQIRMVMLENTEAEQIVIRSSKSPSVK